MTGQDYTNQTARQLYAQAGISMGPQGLNNPAQIEPGLRMRAEETLEHLRSLDSILADIRQSILGPVPEGQSGPAAPPPQCLQDFLLDICHRASTLVSEARTIAGRL